MHVQAPVFHRPSAVTRPGVIPGAAAGGPSNRGSSSNSISGSSSDSDVVNGNGGATGWLPSVVAAVAPQLDRHRPGDYLLLAWAILKLSVLVAVLCVVLPFIGLAYYKVGRQVIGMVEAQGPAAVAAARLAALLLSLLALGMAVRFNAAVVAGREEVSTLKAAEEEASRRVEQELCRLRQSRESFERDMNQRLDSMEALLRSGMSSMDGQGDK